MAANRSQFGLHGAVCAACWFKSGNFICKQTFNHLLCSYYTILSVYRSINYIDLQFGFAGILPMLSVSFYL